MLLYLYLFFLKMIKHKHYIKKIHVNIQKEKKKEISFGTLNGNILLVKYIIHQ